MAASPNSVAATSDIGPPSSPAGPEGKSFVSRAASEDEDTRINDDNPDAADKPNRGKSRGLQSKDASGQQNIGKIRHLKKDDGEPLWREDIQYDFLRAIFDNDQKVFTNTYDADGIGMQTFADLYIDTMSRSSKTSKVLRDKLLSDREAAKGMAMVCLLVNVGRMNTTLNCEFLFFSTLPSLSLVSCVAFSRPRAPGGPWLTLAQSFPKCAHSFEPTMPSHPYRHTKTPMPTSSCRTRPGSSPS